MFSEKGNRQKATGKSRSTTELGQSLMEVVVVLAVGMIVISALVFATIASLRNAQFSKNQVIATKLAQEGIESVKFIRNSDNQDSIRLDSSIDPNQTMNNFSKLWEVNFRDHCGSGVEINVVYPCYFKLTGVGSQSPVIEQVHLEADRYESLEGGMKREVQIKDSDQGYNQEKVVTVIVKWTDFSGEHESKLTTILRKIYVN